MEIQQLIEHKLTGFGITYDEQSAEIALAEVDQSIKNYCHIYCIPKELLFVSSTINMRLLLFKIFESNSDIFSFQL